MSVETYGFKFVVDAKDAAKGYGDFQKAVDGVFDSLAKFEAHAKKTMDAVASSSKRGQTDIAKYANQFKALAKIPVDTTAANKLKTLSEALKGFRAPNATQVANLRSFYRALAGTPNINTGGTARAISTLGAAMVGFKAPSKAQSDRLRDFAKAAASSVPAFQALKGISGVSGIANELASISLAMRNMKIPSKASITNLLGMANALRSFNFSNMQGATGMYSFLRTLSGFRAPSPAQVRNLQSFINAVSNLQVPRNGAQIASVLGNIARAASAAQGQLRGFRGSIAGMPWGSFNAGARQASMNMMGLQNAFSATYQMGSALRTLLGSLTIGELGRAFFDANNRILGFNAAMGSVVEGQKAVNEEFAFASATAKGFGLDLNSTMDGYKKVRISADLAGASVAQTRDMFTGLSGAMSVLGTTAERQNDVWLAVQQVMNKGYLASEELNQQINEHLPGAMGILRNEVKRLGGDFDKLMKDKMIDGTQAMLLIAQKFRDKFGGSFEEAIKRPSAQMNILKANINEFFLAVGKAGANDAFVKLLQRMNSYFTPEKVEKYAQAIGKTLVKAVDALNRSLDWLEQNWDKIKGPLATTLKLLGQWMIVSGTLRIGATLVSPIIGVGTALMRALPFMRQFLILSRQLTTMSIVSPLASGGGAALTGGFATALTQINKFKAAMNGLGSGGVFQAIRTGFSSITGSISPVTGAVMGLAGAIAGGLSIAWGLASKAARDNNIKMASDSYTSGEIIGGIWLRVTKLGVELWSWLADNVGPIVAELGAFISKCFAKAGDFAGDVALFIAYGFLTAFEAILKAAVGLVKGVGNQFSLLASAAGNFMSGNWTAAGADAMKMMTLQGVTDGLKGAFKGFNAGGFSGFKKDVGAGAGVVSQWLADGAEEYRKTKTTAQPKGMSKGEQDLKNQFSQDSQYDPSKLITKPKEGDGDGKKKKGPKPKTQDQIDEAIRRAQEKVDSAVDDIMRRISEDDPVRKVMTEHIKDVSEEAQALLNNDAYSKWIEKVNSGAITGANASQALIEALHGTGVETKVLENLEKRYGVTKADLVALIRKQADETERNLRIAEREKQKKADEREFGLLAIRGLKDELAQRMLTDEQKQISALVQESVNSALDQGTKVTQGMVDALTAEASALVYSNKVLESNFNKRKEFFENNGIRGYLQDIDSLNSAVQNADRNFFQNFEDTLYRLGTEGKLSFKSLIDGIQGDIVRFASQQLTKSFIGLLAPNAENGQSSIFGSLFGMMSGGKFGPGTGDKSMNLRGESPMTPMYVQAVGPNGLMGALTATNNPQGGGFMNMGVAGGENSSGIVSDAYSGIIDPVTGAATDALSGGAMAAQPAIQNSLLGAFQNVAPMLAPLLAGGLGAAIGGKAGGIIGTIASIGMMFLTKGGSGGGMGIPGFKEGGLVGQHVATFRAQPSAFYNAPHYAEGTPNTSGGHPAILHDNEAVIPLSRGRKIGVELTGASSGANGGVTVNNNFTINSPDADSFRKSRGQIATDLHAAGARQWSRNNGG